MIAPHPEVADILIDHSLLDVEAVVDGDFVATDASRRNRNTRVTRRDGTGFFVKQVRVLDPQATESLLREALAGRRRVLGEDGWRTTMPTLPS